MERLHGLQAAILGRAAALVKPGGRLVYVTCSMLTGENEKTADAFEAAHGDFRPVAVGAALSNPAFTDDARKQLAGFAKGHRLRLSPATSGTDGFFAALYERAG